MNPSVVAAAALAALLAGCQATHLIYVYDLSVGIDVAYGNEGTGRLVFGYDRGTYAIVPQRTDCIAAHACTPADETGELMSLVATSYVESSGLDTFEFDHFVSTGDVAVKVAADPNDVAKLREAIFRQAGGN
jgi:hypothetical protein